MTDTLSISGATAPSETTAPQPSRFALLDLVLRQISRTAGSDDPGLGAADISTAPRTLDALLSDEAELPRLIPRMLGLSLFGFTAYGTVVGLALEIQAAHSQLRMSGFWMPLALDLAFIGALGICLPSFYFFAQLAGLDASFRTVTAQALRVQVTTSVLLLGALPFYAAYALACALDLVTEDRGLGVLGLGLPFLVGFLGVWALYRSFQRLPSAGPRGLRRPRFVRRLLFAWGAVYSLVAPVALVRLIDWFSRLSL